MDGVRDCGAGALGGGGGVAKGGDESDLDRALDRAVRTGVCAGGGGVGAQGADSMADFGTCLDAGDLVWGDDRHRIAGFVRGLSGWEGINRDSAIFAVSGGDGGAGQAAFG